jgi:hypothetical protein
MESLLRLKWRMDDKVDIVREMTTGENIPAMKSEDCMQNNVIMGRTVTQVIRGDWPESRR